MSDVRDQILDAALRLLERDRSPAMGAVAQAAGVSRATLYRRFDSAEALWAAVEAERAARAVPGPPRARLLAAARVAFSRAGLHGTSVQQLAATAQVGLATLYTHFGDKEGLLIALIDDIKLDRLEAPAARPAALVAAMVAAARADAGLVRLLLGPDPALARARARLRARLAPVEARLAAMVPDPDVRLGVIAQAAAAGAWGAEPPAAAAARIVGVGDNNGGGGGEGGGRR